MTNRNICQTSIHGVTTQQQGPEVRREDSIDQPPACSALPLPERTTHSRAAAVRADRSSPLQRAIPALETFLWILFPWNFTQTVLHLLLVSAPGNKNTKI
ncbi:hypothetical protein OJAV_G00074550 [Oryzias javanicus]|uniref:Uncharacterized protein n=1 Tax=Oryzias javanicus TaxID=123683 RepID=A0A3S2M6U5_ORYJA|nr:hypothetical protein OJAV_G00074550 [Oryzias javanicus]